MSRVQPVDAAGRPVVDPGGRGCRPGFGRVSRRTCSRSGLRDRCHDGGLQIQASLRDGVFAAWRPTNGLRSPGVREIRSYAPNASFSAAWWFRRQAPHRCRRTHRNLRRADLRSRPRANRERGLEPASNQAYHLGTSCRGGADGPVRQVQRRGAQGPDSGSG